MPLDLIFMGSSADRSGADVALPLAAGEFHVDGNGVPGTATAWFPKADGSIKGAFVNSETAAMVEVWFAKTDDKDRNKLVTTHLQTEPLRTQIMSVLNYGIKAGDSIEAKGENAGTVLDILGLYVDRGNGGNIPVPWPSMPPPKGSRVVRATGVQTLVADTVTEGTLTFDDFVPLRDQWYNVTGLAMNGTTALAVRLRHREGPSEPFRPGVPAADTSTGLEYMMWYGDFGTFRGQTVPNFEAVGVAGDTAQEFYMQIEPVGGPAGGGRRVA